MYIKIDSMSKSFISFYTGGLNFFLKKNSTVLFSLIHFTTKSIKYFSVVLFRYVQCGNSVTIKKYSYTYISTFHISNMHETHTIKKSSKL